jgi:hypothetical protein
MRGLMTYSETLNLAYPYSPHHGDKDPYSAIVIMIVGMRKSIQDDLRCRESWTEIHPGRDCSAVLAKFSVGFVVL